jgi:putative addiction module component (TIGR02574 family)
MNIAEKQDYIHNHLNLLLDKDIDELFGKIKFHVEEELLLTQPQIEEIERRIERHKTGKSKSYPWAEVKDRLVSES